jgi:hypothetical protein
MTINIGILNIFYAVSIPNLVVVWRNSHLCLVPSNLCFIYLVVLNILLFFLLGLDSRQGK